MDEKQALRARLRALRKDYVRSLPDATRALLFLRPPAAIAALAGEGAVIGLYLPTVNEAPTRSYARWFHERGHAIALPWFADPAAPMEFREWENPYAEDELTKGPHGIVQPAAASKPIVPDIVFVPLVGFTADGHRLGQGGGHYDRWLAANRSALPLGLAWDCQLMDGLPLEAHDQQLRAIITPTRLYEGAV